MALFGAAFAESCVPPASVDRVDDLLIRERINRELNRYLHHPVRVLGTIAQSGEAHSNLNHIGSGNGRLVRDDLEDFFTENAGLQVHVIDHNGDEWDGVFLTDALDIRNNKESCSYATSLEFLGVAS